MEERALTGPCLAFGRTVKSGQNSRSYSTEGGRREGGRREGGRERGREGGREGGRGRGREGEREGGSSMKLKVQLIERIPTNEQTQFTHVVPQYNNNLYEVVSHT